MIIESTVLELYLHKVRNVFPKLRWIRQDLAKCIHRFPAAMFAWQARLFTVGAKQKTPVFFSRETASDEWSHK